MFSGRVKKFLFFFLSFVYFCALRALCSKKDHPSLFWELLISSIDMHIAKTRAGNLIYAYLNPQLGLATLYAFYRSRLPALSLKNPIIIQSPAAWKDNIISRMSLWKLCGKKTTKSFLSFCATVFVCLLWL